MTHSFVNRNAYRKLHVFSLIMALALLATGALANTTNTIPYEEDFENPGMGWTNGAVLAGTNGWYDADGGIETVVLEQDYTYPLDAPLNASGSNLVVVSGSISNLFEHAGGDTNVWIDLMVMAAYSATEPVVDEDIQLALYFNTNGQIVVRHRYLTADLIDRLIVWSTLDHPPVPSNQWVRLTITMDYETANNTTPPIEDEYFQIRLNGGEPLTHFYGFPSPDWYMAYIPDNWPPPAPDRNGSWFLNVNTEDNVRNLTSIEIQGEAAFDDLQVKTTNVLGSSGPQYTPKGIPEDWYTGHGLDPETDEEIDSDGDGALNWEEYVAGTIPTNDASVFMLLGVEYAGDSNKVSWYATTDGGAATNPFSMLISTNLQSWKTNALNSIPHNIDGTYDWWDTDLPAEGPVHYRPVILWQ